MQKRKQIIFFKLFWYKVFVHSKLKLLSFLVDSVLHLYLKDTAKKKNTTLKEQVLGLKFDEL